MKILKCNVPLFFIDLALAKTTAEEIMAINNKT